MKIVLFDVQSRSTAINKTMAGGYGTSSKFCEPKNILTPKNILIHLIGKAKKKGVVIPLLTFGYLYRIFNDNGHDVSVVHGKKIYKADIYIIYGSLVEYNSEIETAILIKKSYPKAIIGFIGLFPTVRSDLFIKYADFVIQGESEYFFLKNNISDKLNGILGPEYLDDINILPFPEWKWLNDENKFRHYPFFGNDCVYPAQFSRGCSFPCSYYCAYPILSGKKRIERTVDNMVQELLYLKEKYDAKNVLFRDPNFSIHREITIMLCRKIIEANLGIRWAVEAHPQQLDVELLNIMKKAGAVAITIGIESRDTEVLKSSKRKNTEENHLQKVVRHAENIGISIMAGYIFGQLQDSKETIKATIQYAKKLNTSFAQFVISTPYPGTGFYTDIKNLLTTFEWEKYDTYTLVFDHPTLSFSDLENLKRDAFIAYYFRLKWMLKWMLKKI